MTIKKVVMLHGNPLRQRRRLVERPLCLRTGRSEHIKTLLDREQASERTRERERPKDEARGYVAGPGASGDIEAAAQGDCLRCEQRRLEGRWGGRSGPTHFN